MDLQDDTSGNRVIDRTTSILEVLGSQPAGLSLAALAQQTNLPKSTVHRLCVALQTRRFVMMADGQIQLGPALARLAVSAHYDLVSVARPHITALAQRTRETVDVCVFRGQHAVSVDQYRSDRELRVVSEIGTAFAVHCTAHGKALLSALPDDEVLSLLRGPQEQVELERRTSATRTDPRALLRELKNIRRTGIAMDLQEHADGVCGIGTLIRSNLADRYAIAIAVPAIRFLDKREQLQAELLQCKAEIEAVTMPL